MNIDRLIRSFVDRKWLLICIFVIPARDLSSLLQKEQISQFLCAKVKKKTVQVTLCKISGSPAGDNDSVILAGLELSPSPMRWRSLTLRCRVCLLFVTPNQHKKVFVLYIPGMWKIFLLMLKFFFPFVISWTTDLGCIELCGFRTFCFLPGQIWPLQKFWNSNTINW